MSNHRAITGFSTARSLYRILAACLLGAASSVLTAADDDLITVLNPSGFPPPIERASMAARPASLDGRTVYLVDVTFNNGDVYLQQMQKWFTANMPGVKTIFRRKKGAYYSDDPDLWAEIKSANGLMIMAIGH